MFACVKMPASLEGSVIFQEVAAEQKRLTATILTYIHRVTNCDLNAWKSGAWTTPHKSVTFCRCYLLFYFLREEEEEGEEQHCQQNEKFPTGLMCYLGIQSLSSSIIVPSNVDVLWLNYQVSLSLCWAQSHSWGSWSPKWTLPSMIGQTPLSLALSLAKINGSFRLIIP